jgi:DNA-binding transcriptional MerR regulator
MPDLTIGQLAAHAGVTVRAVRHYHQRGLLAEPERDASGYRRYGAQAVIDLIRIKTLADAGVPLARIQDLLGADPAEFTSAVTQIDEALKQKIHELTQHRRRIAELAGGERLFLPGEVVELLDDLHGLGVSERAVQLERDGWILAMALTPELAPGWVEEKKAALADPEFRRLYLAGDQALSWDPDDPRLEKIAEAMAAWAAQHNRAPAPPDGPPGSDMALVVALIDTYVASSWPALRKLGELSKAIMRNRSTPSTAAAASLGPSPISAPHPSA